MTTRSSDPFTKYQSWRRFAEPGFWVVFYCTWAILDPLINERQAKLYPAAKALYKQWEMVVWFWSNHLVLLALVPFVVAFDRRFPLHWQTLRRHIPWHVAATLIYCVAHSWGTPLLTKAAYIAQGLQYRGSDWSAQLFYFYLKDFRHYLFVILVINFYRLFMLRWQGEASLLDTPDSGAPVEEIVRPERFLVRKVGKEFLLPAAGIEWIQAQGNYVNLRVRGRDYPLRSTMSIIETRLDPKRFLRVHRSYIVNLDHMCRLEALESGDACATMADGAQVPVSRSYVDTLRKMYVTSPKEHSHASTAH